MDLYNLPDRKPREPEEARQTSEPDEEDHRHGYVLRMPMRGGGKHVATVRSADELWEHLDRFMDQAEQPITIELFDA